MVYSVVNNQQNTHPPSLLAVTLNCFLLLHCKDHDTAVLLYHIFRNGGNAGIEHSMSRCKEGVDHRYPMTALSSNPTSNGTVL